MKGLFPMILLLVICIFVLITFEQNIEAFSMPGQCGVGYGNCSIPDGERCVNGYCKKTTPPTLPYLTGLPVWP